MVLNIIGDLLAHGRQLEQFVFNDRIVRLPGKFRYMAAWSRRGRRSERRRSAFAHCNRVSLLLATSNFRVIESETEQTLEQGPLGTMTAWGRSFTGDLGLYPGPPSGRCFGIFPGCKSDRTARM